MKIIFTKDFTSTTLGNVYKGKISELDKKEAEKFIKLGLAEELKAVKEIVKEPIIEKVKQDGDNQFKRSKKPFARRSK